MVYTYGLNKGQSAAKKEKKMKIEEKIKAFAPNDNVEISNFATLNRKCHWKCLKCGIEFEAIPNTILKRHSHTVCQNCNPPLRNKEKKNREDIQKAFQKNSKVKLLNIYTDRYLRVQFQCLECGQIDDFRWNDRKKVECTYCSSSHRNCNQQSFQFLLNQKYDNRFQVLKFNSMTKKALLKCQCGFAFTALPQSSLRSRGIKCPQCQKTRSKAELYIEKYLINNKIFFESEKHFDWMEPHTRYDFYIPELHLIIEFHGEQHYSFIPYFYNNKEDWEAARLRDVQKQEKALENNLNYLIISYNFQNRLKEILDNLFSSTTISEESRAKLLETQNFLNREEDIV